MKRRDFITSSAALATLGAVTSQLMAADGPQTGPREFFELRRYHLRMGPKAKLVDDYFRNALAPALNRAGIDRVGVFNQIVGPDTPLLHLLLPCASLDTLLAAKEKILADDDYLKAASDFLEASVTDPPFVRIESSFLRAFVAMPKLETPLAGKSRIFELRTYESPTEKAARRKIEMFNTAEIGIFHRAGLAPIFFGETIFGEKLPNLTYMVAFADMNARTASWAAFGAEPEWKRLSGLPEYANVVSNITNVFLQPTSYSQI